MNSKKLSKIVVALVLVCVAGLSVTGNVFAQFSPPTLVALVSSRDLHEQYQWALSFGETGTTKVETVRFDQYLAALEQQESDRAVAFGSSDRGKVLAVALPTYSSGDIHEQYQWALLQTETNTESVRFVQYQAALEVMEREIAIALMEDGHSGKGLAVTVPSISSGDAFGQYLWALEMMEKDIQNAVANE